MKYLLSTIILVYSLTIHGQDKQYVTDLSKKLTAKFTNDNNSSGTSYMFDETNPNGFDLFSANVSFSDKNQTQKFGFSPIRLSSKYIFLLSNLRVNVSNTSGAMTTGLSIGNDNSAFESKRVQKIFDNVYSSANIPVARERRQDETFQEYMEYYRNSPKMKSFQDSLLANFDDRRLKHVFKYSAGYNVQFFPVLKSESSNSTFDSLNNHAVRSNNFFVKGSYSFKNGLLNISGAYNYFNKRKSADLTQEKKPYHGFTLGGNIRIPLIKKENLMKKDFYKNTLFVPGIYLGCIYDHLLYKGTEAKFAEEDTKWKSIWTITADFAITPAAQFRIAFPIQKSKLFNSTGKTGNAIVVFQYNFKLVNLSDN